MWDGAVVEGGVSFSWRWEGLRLRGELRAPGPGWVAVGFGTGPGLDGARLVFVTQIGGAPLGEEHEARPPRHDRRAGIPDASWSRGPDGVTGGFSIPGVPGWDGVTVAPGRAVWLTLAYSAHPELDRHSAWRSTVPVDL